MEPFLFENVGQILNCILYCITAFKVEEEKKHYKNKKLSEVAIGGGVSKLQTKSEVLCFFLNLSLIV